MGQLRRENFGPTMTIDDTTAVIAGTTSGYEEFVVLGPVIVITDMTINAASVMYDMDGNNKPAVTVTYPAGFVLRKFFTTLQLASGSCEVVPHRDTSELGLP